MRYPFNVYQTEVEGHRFWVAKSKTLKGCVGQAEVLDEAVQQLEINETEWLDAAAKYEIPIPDVPIEKINEFSGKFTIRMAPYIHQQAVELARIQDISLNQYVNDAIVALNNQLTFANHMSSLIKETAADFKPLCFGMTSTFLPAKSTEYIYSLPTPAKRYIFSQPGV